MSTSEKLIYCSVLVCSILFCFTDMAKPVDDKKEPVVIDRLVYPGAYGYSADHQYHHHHHHNHHHPFDEDYEDDSNDESNSKSTTATPKTGNQNSIPIPLTFIQEFSNKVYTVNDLLLHVEGYPQEDELTDGIADRFAERANVIQTKEAKCSPENRTVNLVENKDPSELYIPSCIRIERCGGCCMHDLLSCQPTKSETVNVQVMTLEYTGKNLKYKGKELVPVDRHISCKCDCRVRAEDCTPVQVYQKNECKCACRNTDEEKKCAKENSTKLWNPNACACQCRQELMCTTGSSFDWRECKCVLKQVRRRDTEMPRLSQRNGYKSGAMGVIPLKADN